MQFHNCLINTILCCSGCLVRWCLLNLNQNNYLEIVTFSMHNFLYAHYGRFYNVSRLAKCTIWAMVGGDKMPYWMGTLKPWSFFWYFLLTGNAKSGLFARACLLCNPVWDKDTASKLKFSYHKNNSSHVITTCMFHLLLSYTHLQFDTVFILLLYRVGNNCLL